MKIPPPEVLIDRVRGLPAARPLLERLGDEHGVYLVGGAVRDLLLGGRPSDLDLVVEGDAAAIARRLGEPRIHDRFGTSTVAVDGFAYDIARARSETYEHPGALPRVAPARLEDDLRRRDFTVNALAIALSGEKPGALTAFPGALEDLDQRRLRVLHERSFIDDPTRLLRLVRYASRLGFTIEERTQALLEDANAEKALQTVSGSRVGAELRLLAREHDPLAAFAKLGELGLDRAIHPSFGLGDAELARRALELLPGDGRPDLLVLALAARAVPQSDLEGLLDGLAFEAHERDLIIAAASRADPVARALRAARAPSEVAAAAGSAAPELVALAGALGPARQAGEWLERLRHVRLEIDGHDLVQAGVPQGPAIGIGLQAALAAKLDGTASGRDAELERALRAAQRSS